LPFNVSPSPPGFKDPHLFVGPMPSQSAPGDPIVLKRDDSTHLFLVPEPGDTVDVDGIGVVSGDLLADLAVGDRMELGRTAFRVLSPTPQLVFEARERGAQVIRPADAARIAHLAAIGPGTRVVEGGAGSGALTAYLAHLVGDDGRVVTVDRRQDHLDVARRNVERAGLADRVSFRKAELAGVEEACDAFVVDVPSPADVAPAVEDCLRPGGRVVFYNPLVDQVQAVREALDEAPFAEVRTLEALQRDWVVHERGARPDFDMLGHTGFLTAATRVTERS
jgi:tRNA (adenine57-N1/adenine58-N1)-methyltransferase